MIDEAELSAVLQRQIQSATGYLGGEITEDRRKAMRAYMGEPLGNEIEGRSQVVSSDVLDVVEAVMPDIMQIFTSSDEAVEFAPRGEGDEEAAQQATDYVNYIWNVDNEGPLLYHDLFKDALLQKMGVGKVWWDEEPGETRSTHTGLDADQVAIIMDADDVEVIEHEEYWPEKTQEWFEEQGIDPDAEDIQMPEGFDLIGKLHDITVKRKVPPRIRIDTIPPENFLVSRRAKSLNDAPFVCHWEEVTESDLIEDGYDPEQIRNIPNESENEFNEERTARFNKEDEFPFNEQPLDRSTRNIIVYECYVKIDMDDDGIAELRKVKVAGPAYEVLRFKNGDLDDEPVYDHPFFSVTPVRVPHKFFGRSLAELVMDIYQIKTSLWRSLLDNVYNVNNARSAISSRVNLDDYLDNKVGAPIRVDSPNADVGGHIFPIQTPSIGNHIYPAMEYIDTVRETRTGINRLGQGLDPDALNSTASGINQLLGRSQQRTLLIAQMFAHGIRDAFKKILRLTIMHQDKPRVIRLRNEWVDIDPRVWDADMDVTVNVGLGRGTQDQKIATAQMVLEATMNLLQIQGGLSGPFILPHHVRNAFAKFYEVSGLKSADPYIEEITEQTSQQIVQQMSQQPDPEAEKVKGEQALKQAELQLKAQEQETNAQIKFTEAQLDHIRKLTEMGHAQEAEQAKLELDIHIANQKAALEEYKINKQAQTQRSRANS